MTAAGFAPGDDPLLDTADAWVYVLDEVQRALGIDAERMAELEARHDAPEADAPGVATETVVPALPETREALLMLLWQLQAHALMVKKASVRAPEDPSLPSKPVDAAGASDGINAANEARHEYA